MRLIYYYVTILLSVLVTLGSAINSTDDFEPAPVHSNARCMCKCPDVAVVDDSKSKGELFEAVINNYYF